MWVRSLKIIEDGTIRKLGYAFSYLQMAASLAVCEISIVKEWCDLENWVRGRSTSLKMAPFDRPYTTFYWSAIVAVGYLVPFSSYLTLNNIVTLKSGLEGTQGH